MESYFLRIKAEIKGESKSAEGNRIALLSWSQSITLPGTNIIDPSAKTGRAEFSHLQISKYLDSTTPVLNQYTASTTNFKSAVLTVYMNDKDTGTPIEYYSIEMEDILITSMSVRAEIGGRIVETLTIKFAKIKWTYTPQKKDSPGGGAGKIAGSWDLEKNVK